MSYDLWSEITYIFHSLLRTPKHSLKTSWMSVWSVLWEVQSEQDGWLPVGSPGRHRDGTSVFDLVMRLHSEQVAARKAAEDTKRRLTLAAVPA